jgi:solute carrier family 13 (sodium-dependent dicarboxylate transporter), member 2/3/5
MPQDVLSIVIILIAVILFATEKIPLAMTALLTSLTMAILGIISYSDSLSGFGSPTVMMVIGMIIVGKALFETGLAQLIGNSIFTRVGNNEKKFLFAIIIIASVLSGFLSNTATVAMFMPIIASVAAQSKGKITKKNTFMALGFAAVLGGNTTLVGSTPQLVAQGILAQTEGVRTLAFFEIGLAAVPMVLIMIVYFAVFGYNYMKKVFDFPEYEDEDLIKNLEENKTADPKKMFISGAVLVGCVICFVLELWNVGVIAMLGASILILTGCISEKKAYQSVDWSTVVILGAAIGFSKGLAASGGGQLITDAILNLMGGPQASPFLVMAAIVVISVALGNVMSHTATAAMMTPIVLGLAQSIGANPISFVLAAVIGCNLAFATPVGTTPVTMTLVGGYRFKDYTKVGGILTIILTLALIIVIPLVYGL